MRTERRRASLYQRTLSALHDAFPQAVITLRTPTLVAGPRSLVAAQPLSTVHDPQGPFRRIVIGFDQDGIKGTVVAPDFTVMQPDPNPVSVEDLELTTWDDIVGFISVARNGSHSLFNGPPPAKALRLPYVRKLAAKALDLVLEGTVTSPVEVAHEDGEPIVKCLLSNTEAMPVVQIGTNAPATFAHVLRVYDEDNPLALAHDQEGDILTSDGLKARTLEGTAQWALGKLP
jgi:hypothetical protein